MFPTDVLYGLDQLCYTSDLSHTPDYRYRYSAKFRNNLSSECFIDYLSLMDSVEIIHDELTIIFSREFSDKLEVDLVGSAYEFLPSH